MRSASEWDKIVSTVSDESEEVELRQSHLPLYRKIHSLLNTHDIGNKKNRADVAYFVAVQTRGEYSSNVPYHVDIIDAFRSRPALMKTEVVWNLADLLHQLQAEKVEKDYETNRVLIEAISTLVACQVYGPVNLFHAICTPSTEADKELRRRYEVQEFAKPIIVHAIYGEERSKTSLNDLVNPKEMVPETYDSVTIFLVVLMVLLFVLLLILLYRRL